MLILFSVLAISTGLASSYQTTEALRLRAKPSWSASVIKVVPKWEIVNRISCSASWCLVAYQNSNGYVPQQYLTPVGQGARVVPAQKPKPAKATAKKPIKRSSTTYRIKKSKPVKVQSNLTSSSGGSVYFSSCSAARAAGYSRMRPGEPGYRGGLDRDGDGVACE